MADIDLLVPFFILGISLLFSAFFSAAEVAFVSISPAKIRALVEERQTRSARILAELKNKPHRVLAAILIASNVINTFAAGFATVVAMKLFGDAGLAIATGVMSFLILAFTDIFPKSLAQRHATSIALAFAYPLQIINTVLLPLSWGFEKILHLVGASSPMKTMTEEELLALVEIGHEEGEIKEHERELIQNVLEFTDTIVEEVMTPRVAIEALEKNKTVAEATKYFIQHSHSRIPIYDEGIDQVIGILTLRDILEAGDTPAKKIGELPLMKPIFTPASRLIRALFQEFQSRHVHLAIVVDEHGGTIGLVTLEDLLEEIVGEIEDEEDIPEEGIRVLNNRTILAPADTLLSEVDEKLKTKLSSAKYDTKNLAFLILDKLGRLPKKNDKLRFGSAELTVEEVGKNKIRNVKIEKI